MSRRFRFRLQPVLDLRVWDEEQASHALAAKTAELVRAQQRLEDLHRRRHGALGPGGAVVDLARWVAGEAYRGRLTREIGDTELELARLTVERDDRLKVWREAKTRREVLEKLSQRRRDEHKKAELRREVLAQDDLNTAAHIRKMRPVEEGIG